MNFRVFFITFGTIFLAELFDKTELAVLSLAAKEKNQPVSAASRGVCSILILSLVHSLPWNEVNYVYDFGFIPVASHGVFAERE